MPRQAVEPQTHSQSDIHKEKVFEEHIVKQLVEGQGYVERECGKHYDAKHALDPELLFEFLKTTQPAVWKKLEERHLSQAEETIINRLEKSLRAMPAHMVLRNGIKLDGNIQFRLSQPKPSSDRNEDLTALYEANILSVMRQLKYSTKNENAIDIALFVNGIPVVTIEVKNLLTGQNYRSAEEQYKTDRSPAAEPLLTFKRGAIAHFAVDQDNASMTTRLRNGKTRFLPFNRGRDGGQGNSDIEGENNTAYLYKDIDNRKAVFSREVLLDIIDRFVHLEKENGSEKLLFPRYHQLDAVRKILEHAKNTGSGQNYLIQHSAGSGKSNTIAWTAHQIIHLHDNSDNVIFDSAIIVTDRKVLDQQLQDTISGFEETKGVVETIDGTSRQLRQAIEDGKRIIVTTIQKFSTEHLADLSGQGAKKFAVIIDEAHSSQSGKAADAMTGALTRGDDIPGDLEELILKYQEARGPQQNISFLAFTATPRTVTLERFGQTGQDEMPQAFHMYSMRQAIEEGFILDVLQNYTTYEAYYQLEKAIEDDPRFLQKKAKRRVARFASLHPTAIDQKVEVIIEHFLRHVANEMKGQAKAMVVTQSRDHALRYYQRMNEYIATNKIEGIKTLVAFSGELEFEDDGKTWTEAMANQFSERELPKKFDSDEYQVLVVAEKYQTGFDQPKLVAMYVDKPLSGLQAVQTLSRLNRTHPDKKNTYILDMQNTVDDIREAFKPYYEATSLSERTDLSQIYDLEELIMAFSYPIRKEIEQFAAGFFKDKQLTTDDRLQLEALVRKAVDRFTKEKDEARQEEFRQLIRSYMRFYIFVTQIIHLEDAWMENLYVYLYWLNRRLPQRTVPSESSVTDDMMALRAFRLDKTAEGDAKLGPGDTGDLDPIEELAPNYTEEEKEALSTIIDNFNERHGTQFTEADFVRFESVTKEVLEDEQMIEMLRNNPVDVVEAAFGEAFFKAMVRSFRRDNELKNIVMTDAEARAEAIGFFFQRAIKQVMLSDNATV